MIMSGNEAWNRNAFKHWRKVDRDGADITLSGRLFQMVGPATRKARPPTVDSFTDGTSRRLVRAERRERRPGRSATRTSWLSLMAFMLDCVAVGCRWFLTWRPRYPYTVTSRGSALVFQCNVEPDRVDCQSDNVYEISLNDKWFV